MPKTHTHYDNLKVARNAPVEVIEAAFRALAQKYHPDRNPNGNAARIMGMINAAHGVLSDPEQRRRHDEWIHQMESTRRIGPWVRGVRSIGGLLPWRFRWRSALTAFAGGVGLGLWIWHLWPSNGSPELTALSAPTRQVLPPIPEREVSAVNPIAAAAVVHPHLPKARMDANAQGWRAVGPAVSLCSLRFELPTTGIMSAADADRADWPALKITAGEAVDNTYVKVLRPGQGTVAILFVQRGDAAVIRLPPGDYQIKYVSGSVWHGEQVQFCQKYAMESEQAITLRTEARRNGVNLIGEEIELQPQIAGNFGTREIPNSDF
jgi:curved DNA-binding protein CbpA